MATLGGSPGAYLGMKTYKEISLCTLCLILVTLIASCSAGADRHEDNLVTSSAQDSVRTPGVDFTPDDTVYEFLDTPQPDPSGSGPALESTPLPESDPYRTTNRIWGIEMHNISADGGLDLVTDAGADWVRLNGLFWSQVETRQGVYDWSSLAGLEKEISNATDSGLELILVVRGTPSWAQLVPGAECGPIQEDKIAAFADFMHAAVARYSVPPYNVRYWEIWNEPDVISDPRFLMPDTPFGCWGDPGAPYYGGGYYARVLSAVYPRIKVANPDAQLLVGGLLLDCDPVNPPTLPDGGTKDCTPSTYLQGILEAGGGEYFDGISFHAYDYYGGQLGVYGNPNWESSSNLTGPALHAKTRYLRSVLYEYRYPDKYLINSEVALICGNDQKEPECASETFNLTKAYYVTIAYAGALAEGLQANIWYSIIGWRASGLVQSGYQPLPALDALQFSARQLRNVTYVDRVDQYPGIMGFEFARDGERVWLIWSHDSEDHLLQLEEMPSAIYDPFGGLLPRTRSLSVTTEPVYLEWKP